MTLHWFQLATAVFNDIITAWNFKQSSSRLINTSESRAATLLSGQTNQSLYCPNTQNDLQQPGDCGHIDFKKNNSTFFVGCGGQLSITLQRGGGLLLSVSSPRSCSFSVLHLNKCDPSQWPSLFDISSQFMFVYVRQRNWILDPQSGG